MNEQRINAIEMDVFGLRGQAQTRRGVVRLFGVAAVATAATIGGLDAADAKRKKHGKKHGKKHKSPKPIARLRVPAANNIVQTPVLATGKTYRFRASGSISVFQTANPNVLYGKVDADYIYSPTNAFPPSDGPAGFNYGISIDGGDPEWGAFQKKHIYQKTVVGDGRALDLRIWFDRDNFPNVAGSILVEIFAA